MRSRTLPLRTLLPSLVLAVSPLGCGSDEDPATPPGQTLEATPMTETLACDALDAARYVGLTPAAGIEGIAFFHVQQGQSAPDAGSAALDPVGTPCGGAANQQACLDEVAAAVPTTGWQVADPTQRGNMAGGGRVTDYGVLTRGSTVTPIQTLEELRAAVAPIDGIDEAKVFATIMGVPRTCGAANARIEDDGITFQSLDRSCNGRVTETLTKMTWDGKVTTLFSRELQPADNNCVEGRRPEGLVARSEPWLLSLRGHFTEIAHMEAAAVLAFDSLAHDLAGLGAPAELLARVARARHQEVDHAARMAAIAGVHGGQPVQPELTATERARSVLALALENEMEGCVRETYGALVATHQALHAADPAARAAFARIAADETEHAELSRDIGAWLGAKLSEAERAIVAHARTQAWAELERACDVEPAAEVLRDAGMPSARIARQLLHGLRAAA